MLVLWCGAEVKVIKDVIGPVLRQHEVPHRVEPDISTLPHLCAGDVVLAFGTKVLKTLQDMGVAPKGRTVTSTRGTPFGVCGAKVLVTFDPGVVSRDYARLPDIQWDIQLAVRLHNTGTVEPIVGKYTLVESFHEIIDRVEYLHGTTGAAVEVACDLETKGLDEFAVGAWIISCSFTVDSGVSQVAYFSKGERPQKPPPGIQEDHLTYWQALWEQINWLLTTSKISLRGANFKFDSRWLNQHWGIDCTNHKFDTTLVGSLLDENRCVAPETLILTSDLRWVRADSLQSGDSVVGFDEHGDQGIHRRMRKSLVSSSEVIKKRRLKLNLSNGHSIVVSDNHQFLCKKYPSTHVKVWRKAKNIQPGCVIFSATPHPKDIQGEASDYELGRLSGFLDGEGSVPKLNDVGSWHLGWGQIPHSAHQDMKRVASLIKAEYREHDDNLNLCKSVVFKGAWNSLHALIATRPLRLVAKEPWDNGPLPRGDEAVSVSVLSVEDLGVGPVVALETTTHTFIAEGLLSHNSNSLKLHAKLFTNLGGYEDGMDKYDFSCLEKVPVTELVQYNGGDTDATLQVATHFKKQLLKDRQLVNFYTKVTHPASKAFERLERNGIYVDVPYYHRLQNELEVEIDRIHSELIGMMPTALRNKYADNLKITRPALLRDFLFTPAGLNLKAHLFTAAENLPSTAMDHLLSFKDNPDASAFISLLNEHGSATKTLSTYVVGFLKHLRSDGKFHPSFMLHRGGYGDSDDDTGTVTGRCLTAEARILTDKGEIQIKELIELFESGVSFQVLTHKNRWMPVTQVYRNGPKPVCTVKAAGRSLTSTYNHPFMSFPSWTLAEDLKVGSWLYAKASPPPLEEWLPVTGWPFEVSNMGRVRRALDGKNVTAGTLVAQRPKGPWGHLKVTLTRFVGGRDKKDFPVHTLVADAFLKNNGGVEVAHLNGDASCNWSTNLKRVSVSENKLHFMLHGTANRDSQKKLTWAKVDAIRSGALGDDHEASAALFVSRELVRDVRLFKRWNGRRDSMAGFIPIQVEAILDAGVQDTFDLTVEEDHSFIANGLVVHNTSAKAPAVQTIPKHTKWSKRLRRAFIAPPGYTILNLDYSQGELRICAVVAEEPTMIQAYRDGKDLHAITAAGLNGYSFEEFMLLPDDVRDELRSGGKAGNFGLIYGMQHLGFRDYAWYSYGVSMTDEEAFNARRAFFDLYTRLLPWHEESKKFARLRGYIRSPLGRIRHLPLINSPDRESRAKAERQAINSPIQSALSDLMQMAMVAINRQYGHEDIRAFMMTHDSLSLYVPTDRAHEWAVRLRDIMENLPLLRDFGWDSPLKFIADAEVGVPDDEGVISLAKLQKVKFL